MSHKSKPVTMVKKTLDAGSIRIIVCGRGANKAAATRNLNKKMKMIEHGIEKNSGSLRV